jgi:hypothetical protein
MKTQTGRIVALLMMSTILLVAVHVVAGNLDPDSAPAPTMRTLDEIYDAVSSSGVKQVIRGIVSISNGVTTATATLPSVIEPSKATISIPEYALDDDPLSKLVQRIMLLNVTSNSITIRRWDSEIGIYLAPYEIVEYK